MGFLLEKNEREGPKPPDSNPREYLEPNRSARPATFGPSSQWHLKRFAQSESLRPSPALNAEWVRRDSEVILSFASHALCNSPRHHP